MKALPKGISRVLNAKGDLVAFLAMAGVVNGEKQRKRIAISNFDGDEGATLDAIKQWYNDKRKEILNNRHLVIDVPDKLRLQINEARELLEPYGLSLLEAARIAVEQMQRRKVYADIGLAEAISIFLKAKTKEDCKASYLDSLRKELTTFSNAHPETNVSEVTADSIEEFLEGRGPISPVTWNNYRRDLRTFFNFAAGPRYRWIRSNPVESVAYKKVLNDEVQILKLEEVKKLLKAAHHHETPNHRGSMDKGRQVPWLVLGLFGGLRRDEADAAQWEDIDWEGSTIKVRSAKARSARNRYVHMELPPPDKAANPPPPVLRKWLELYKCDSGPIGTGIHARRNDLQKLAELTELPLHKNLFRHSFGSYHVHSFEDKQKTMLEMGHTVVRTFDSYYNQPMSRMRALAYWELTPEEVL
jgi:integrase